LFLADAPLADAQDTPGFQFLGYGYDALRGNPLATDGLGDTGFRTNVFKFSHSSKQRTPDNKWAVPDKTTAQALSSCSLEQTTHVINSAYTYEKTVSNSVDLTGEYSGVQGEFSVESKHVQQRTDNRQSIFAQIQSLCSVYKLTMHLFDHPPLDGNFIAGVKSLPTSYNQDAYMEFLKSFGTHVIVDMTLGGRWGWQMEFKLDDWQAMTDYSIDIAASLSYAGKAKAGLKVDHSVDTKVQNHVVNSISSNSSFNIGGSYHPDVQQWQASVAASPMPVLTTLKKLSDFVTPDYFSGWSGSGVAAAVLAQKQSNLDSALQHYCEYLKRTEDSSVSCTPPAPIPLPTPRPVNTIRGMCMHNGGGYVMSFEMKADGTPKKAGSGHFSLGKTKCIDAEDIDAREGDVLKCHMHAEAGKSKDCPGDGYKFSWYSKLKAHYECHGTTLSIKCSFTGLSEHDGMMVMNATEAVSMGFSDVLAPLITSSPGSIKQLEKAVGQLESIII